METGHDVRVRAPARQQGVNCESCATRPLCVLADLDPQRLRGLKPHIRQRSFRKGDVLVQEGVLSPAIHIVKVGSVFGQRRGLDGASRPVGLWSRGGVFSLCSFFGQPSQLSVLAATEGRACAVDVQALSAEASINPALHGRITATMVRCYGRMAAWSEAMRLPGVANQLAYTLLLLAEVQGSTVVEMPHQKALAALLGTTRESIARAMATLERTGAVFRREPRVCEVVRERILGQLRSVDPTWDPPAATQVELPAALQD